MIIHDYFTRPGRLHAEAGISCQDRAAVRKLGDVTAVVLCDGAGSFHAGAEAAGIVSRLLADTLAGRFRELYFSDGETARRTISQLVEERLSAHSRSAGIPPQALACTILAAAVHADGRCVCFHLGDGVILQQNLSDDVPSIVSAPMNGLLPHSTYLTMNCDLWQYLRYYRWKCADLERLLLMTDGAAEYLMALRGGMGWVYTADCPPDAGRLLQVLQQDAPEDDYSAASIRRDPQQPDAP